MQDFQNIESTVAELIRVQTKIDVSPQQYEQDLHLDSLAILEVTIGLERTYGIEVDEAELDVLQIFRSVRSIANFITSTRADQSR